jgi:hypothetical protein
MAEKRRQEREGRIERQRASLCQETRDELEASTARGRQTARLFLRKNDRHEAEIDERKNRKGSEFED